MGAGKNLGLCLERTTDDGGGFRFVVTSSTSTEPQEHKWVALSPVYATLDDMPRGAFRKFKALIDAATAESPTETDLEAWGGVLASLYGETKAAEVMSIFDGPTDGALFYGLAWTKRELGVYA